MKIKSANTRSCMKCLQLSLPVDMMLGFAILVNPNYDFHKRSGYKEGMPIPNDKAAEQIVTDMIQDGFFVDFVEFLLRVDAEGYMGRQYTMWGMNNVVTGLINEGYNFDKTSGRFIENPRERISPGWGRLQEGDERKMTILRVDIAGNSALVKSNPRSKIEKAYKEIRNIVHRAVTNRLGRLWSWEGDGAIAAFLFGSMEKMAVYAGMEIIHEIFFYNRIGNPLDSPINVRLGAQIGQVRYSDNEVERLKNDTVQQATLLEALATNNSLSVSYNLYINMDRNTLNNFGDEKFRGGLKYRLYTIGIGK